MSFFEITGNQGSIRRYQDQRLPDETVRMLIESAITAPSPSNSQPVRFFHLISDQARNNLRNDMEKEYQHLLELAKSVDKPKKAKNLIQYYWRFSNFMLEVKDLFLVGTVKESGFFQKLKKTGMDDNLPLTSDLDITTGISVMKFLHQAMRLDLGTCVLTAPFLFIDKWIIEQELYGTSPKCFITCGYPAEAPKTTPRKPFEEIYRQL